MFSLSSIFTLFQATSTHSIPTSAALLLLLAGFLLGIVASIFFYVARNIHYTVVRVPKSPVHSSLPEDAWSAEFFKDIPRIFERYTQGQQERFRFLDRLVRKYDPGVNSPPVWYDAFDPHLPTWYSEKQIIEICELAGLDFLKLEWPECSLQNIAAIRAALENHNASAKGYPLTAPDLSEAAREADAQFYTGTISGRGESQGGPCPQCPPDPDVAIRQAFRSAAEGSLPHENVTTYEGGKFKTTRYLP